MPNDDRIVKLLDGPCAGYMYAIVGRMPELHDFLYVMENDGGVVCYFEYKVTHPYKQGDTYRLANLSRELLGSEFKRLSADIKIETDSGTRTIPIYRSEKPDGGR